MCTKAWFSHAGSYMINDDRPTVVMERRIVLKDRHLTTMTDYTQLFILLL